MNTTVLFSRNSDEWATPLSFFLTLNESYQFGVDAAATQDNRKCVRYYGLDGGDACLGNALTTPWCVEHGVHWCNPPYSECRAFVTKAAHERTRGIHTIMLIPSRTDTRWFHDCLWDVGQKTTRPGIHLDFIRGRLKFGDEKNSAPFPSMVVSFLPTLDV